MGLQSWLIADGNTWSKSVFDVIFNSSENEFADGKISSSTAIFYVTSVFCLEWDSAL
jgi:hypothetical protein